MPAKLPNITDLRNEVASLQAQKQDLDRYNQKIVYTSIYSKQIVDFNRRAIDSLRNEIIGLLSILVFVMPHFI